MDKLLISKVISLHPNASTSSSAKPPSSRCLSFSSSARTCLMGCVDVKPSDLRRFPVHDPNRCKHWLRYFRISDQLLTKLGGLNKLRICHRHFHNPQATTKTATETRQSTNERQSQSQSQVQVMARTRIKMTPLRKTKQQFNSNNGNGTPTNTTTTTTPQTTATTTIINGTGTGKPLLDDATTIELVETPIEVVAKQKHHQMIKNNSVTTITLPTMVTVPPPPPPLLLPPQRSHSICSSASSDVQSINSDYEATSLDNLENGRKRKLYVITEKYDEKAPTTNKNASDLTNGNGLNTKKRKMFVVVEQEKDGQSKKLMIMTDKQENGIDSEKLEKLLPELLNRIQTKELQQQQIQQQDNKESSLSPPPPPATSAEALNKSSSIIANKSPITLPPKKNPTNFIKVEKSSSSSLNQREITTPSAHSVTILPSRKDDQMIASNDLETNINLSPDFRFLMKILPKLEQLPEPHKQDVKRSIQIFVEKSYSIYGKKD